MSWKYSVCPDCKILYGHPIRWCPACPKEMEKWELRSDEVEALRKSFRLEGDIKYEYIYRQQIFKNFDDLVQKFAVDIQPYLTFNIIPKVKFPYSPIYFRWVDSCRLFYPYIEYEIIKVEPEIPVYKRILDSDIWFEYWTPKDKYFSSGD